MREHEKARQAVNQLRDELSANKAKHAEETALLRKDIFEIRMKIELAFRKTKKTSEDEYERAANGVMTKESEVSLASERGECKRELAAGGSLLRQKRGANEASKKKKKALLQSIS
jgi:hypothetical protein